MGNKVVRWTAGTVVVVATFELFLHWVWPYVDEGDPVPRLEKQVALLAALALLALPHAIAVLGYRGRPALLKVAAIVALLLGTISLIPITLAVVGVPLLLVPSYFYFRASRGAEHEGRVALPLLAISASVCAIVAAGAFFFTEDSRCRIESTVPGGGTAVTQLTCNSSNEWGGGRALRDISYSGTSDVVAFHESVPSLLLSLGALALCAWGAAPSSAPRKTSPSVA